MIRTIPKEAFAAALNPPCGDFDAETMLQDACRATGLAHFGTDAREIERFRHDFAVLCGSLNEDAALSEIGNRRAHSRLRLMLACRLSSIAQREEDPHFNRRTIAAPLIGTGLPRTGTTFLHGLLASDPAHRAVRAWEAMLSQQLVGDIGTQPDRLFQKILQFQGFMDGNLREIHPFDASLQEECVFLQESNCSALYAEFFAIPAFAAAIADKAYDDLRWQIGQMKLLQRSTLHKRWVLKAPTHLFTWNETVLAFPDARIFINHRDPAHVIPSVTALTVAIRGLFSQLPPDVVMIARERLDAWSSAMRDVTAWRDDHPEFPVVDVHFRDLVERPLETVATLYDQFGLPLSVAATDAMQRYLLANQRAIRPTCGYSLADCGLDRSTVELAFADYIEHYRVARES